MRLAQPAAAFTLLALFSTACAERPAPTIAGPETPSFIVNGEPTGSDFGNVGALLWDWNGDGKITGDDQWCTGSLISPTVFLTAAHCIVSSYTPPGTQFYVSFSADLLSKSLKVIKAEKAEADPLYGHDQANLHDLAVIILPKSSTKGIMPLRLPPEGYLDDLHAQGGLKGKLFINVGYGTSATRTGVPDFPWDGLRNWSRSEFLGLQPTWLGLNMNTSATGEGGDCYGDSGGPKFLDPDRTMVLATVTTGDYPCRATSWDWRLDTPEARGFLGKFVALP